MRVLILAAGAALALSACSGRDDTAVENDLNMSVDNGVMMEDPTLNTGMDANMTTNVDANMMANDMDANMSDTNTTNTM